MSENGNGNGKLVHGLDIPIVKLVPRNERTVGTVFALPAAASSRRC